MKSQIPDSASDPNILSDCLDQLNATLSIFGVIDGTVTTMSQVLHGMDSADTKFLGPSRPLTYRWGPG